MAQRFFRSIRKTNAKFGCKTNIRFMADAQPQRNPRGPLSARGWHELERRWHQQRLVAARQAELETAKAAQAKPIAPIVQRDIFTTRRFGKPRGKQPRPQGTLSILETMSKYGIINRTLTKWRKAGLPSARIGTLIVIKERDLKRWLRKSQPKTRS